MHIQNRGVEALEGNMIKEGFLWARLTHMGELTAFTITVEADDYKTCLTLISTPRMTIRKPDNPGCRFTGFY